MITPVLSVAALICFIVALVDRPPMTATRCVALGLALLTLAQLLAGVVQR